MSSSVIAQTNPLYSPSPPTFCRFVVSNGHLIISIWHPGVMTIVSSYGTSAPRLLCRPTHTTLRPSKPLRGHRINTAFWRAAAVRRIVASSSGTHSPVNPCSPSTPPVRWAFCRLLLFRVLAIAEIRMIWGKSMELLSGYFRTPWMKAICMKEMQQNSNNVTIEAAYIGAIRTDSIICRHIWCWFIDRITILPDLKCDVINCFYSSQPRLTRYPRTCAIVAKRVAWAYLLFAVDLSHFLLTHSFYMCIPKSPWVRKCASESHIQLGLWFNLGWTGYTVTARLFKSSGAAGNRYYPVYNIFLNWTCYWCRYFTDCMYYEYTHLMNFHINLQINVGYSIPGTPRIKQYLLHAKGLYVFSSAGFH